MGLSGEALAAPRIRMLPACGNGPLGHRASYQIRMLPVHADESASTSGYSVHGSFLLGRD